MNTSAGEPTAALYGFSTLLLKLLRELRPGALAFARDLPGPTFRHERYDASKAGRPPMPEALRTQWRRLDELIAVTCLAKTGPHEARKLTLLAHPGRRFQCERNFA